MQFSGNASILHGVVFNFFFYFFLRVKEETGTELTTNVLCLEQWWALKLVTSYYIVGHF